MIVGNEFRKNMSEQDPAKVELLKGGAIRALSSYLLIESSSKDERLNKRAAAFVKSEASSIRGQGNESETKKE